ncbi:MAG: carbohydrate ABC transporter permease [Chloroflexi bacterium OHK40]
MSARIDPLPTARARARLSAARGRAVAGSVALTLVATLLAALYLLPMAYAVNTALRQPTVETDAPFWPARPRSVIYEGEAYDIYRVPLEGGVRELALVRKGRERSTFVDPANPAAPIVWEGRWRTLERVWVFSPNWGNFSEAWTTIKFGRLFFNTFAIAVLGTVGTLISSTLVAYGFARFRIPARQVLFLILIATIILPPQVTQIPTYTIFRALGWTNTWLPLIIPHFFANAYNVFLLRQFFMAIPRELDEAATIDGAGPLRVLIAVIVPQAMPALFTVGLFHFFWAWNDFFGPLIYLSGRRDLWPISVGMQAFNATYAQRPDLIQATALMAIALPVIVFLLAQRAFLQGVVFTGVEK